MYGTSNNAPGVTAENNTTGNVALWAQQDNGNSGMFFAYNSSTGGQCGIDSAGTMTCSGGFQGASVQVRHRTSGGQHVLAYAAQSASSTIEDVGTAKMVDGIANVQIEPTFASVMDGKWYYVFVTPLGDTRGLYVSMKSRNGFQVREIERGRSNVDFDYRIVAHPFGAKDDRLPPAPAMHRPNVSRPAH
ncbi:MAG: hypothetical protein WB615_00760 [Candidatus Tumulicola sp.]